MASETEQDKWIPLYEMLDEPGNVFFIVSDEQLCSSEAEAFRVGQVIETLIQKQAKFIETKKLEDEVSELAKGKFGPLTIYFIRGPVWEKTQRRRLKQNDIPPEWQIYANLYPRSRGTAQERFCPDL